jgi:hypothetical protein
MESAIRDDSMVYNKIIRCYAYYIHREEPSYQIIEYCPFCGTELPKELSLEYDETVFESFGQNGMELINGEFFPSSPELPDEFKSDEWWKKRGL